MAMSPSVVLRQRRFPSFLAMLAVAVLTVAGCDDSTGNDDSIASITVNPPTPVLNIGSVQQLVASPTTASGKLIEGATVSWISSAPGVATVSNTGLVTAVGGGTTVITATSGDVSATANVTVWGAVTAIALAPAAGGSTTIRQEGSVTIVPTFTVTSGPTTGRQVVWTSSNPAVADVNQSGVVVSRLVDGTATITAATLVGGVSQNIVITVSGAPVVATVALTVSNNRYMGIGDTEQLVATARAASGTVLALTGRTVVWSTSNATNATVSATGLVTNNVSSGTANIAVTVDGVAATGPANIQIVGRETLGNNVPRVINIAAGAITEYVINVPAGTDTLVATITGGSADPDIYVIRPVGTTACSPFLSGSNETCRIAAPVAGRWRIAVEAWQPAGAVTGVEVRARVVDNP